MIRTAAGVAVAVVVLAVAAWLAMAALDVVAPVCDDAPPTTRDGVTLYRDKPPC